MEGMDTKGPEDACNIIKADIVEALEDSPTGASRFVSNGNTAATGSAGLSQAASTSHDVVTEVSPPDACGIVSEKKPKKRNRRKAKVKVTQLQKKYRKDLGDADEGCTQEAHVRGSPVASVVNTAVMAASDLPDKCTLTSKELYYKYDRDFLLNFCYMNHKPRNLPDLDIILAHPVKHFTAGMTSQSLQVSVGWYSGQGQCTHRAHGKTQKVISLPKTPQAKLHTTANPYKVEKKKEEGELTAEEFVQSLNKKMRCILNKLTPQKFDTLFLHALELLDSVTTKRQLDGIIQLIFEKAIDEPSFSIGYAVFCRLLCQQNISIKDGNKEKTFRIALLNCCQREFEANKEKELKELIAKHDGIIATASKDHKKEAMENKEQAILRHRQRIFGNIRFIGELYRLGLLTPRIMHQCILVLLRKPDPDSVECLCKLLVVIGSMLDMGAGKAKVDLYMQEVKKIADGIKVSRIKFLVMDVFDLRKDNWISKDQDNPKTIQEINLEAAQERVKNLLALQKLCQEQSETPRNKINGWSKVDDTKLTLPKPEDDAEAVQQGAKQPVQLGEKKPAQPGEKKPAQLGEKKPAQLGKKKPARPGENKPPQSGKKKQISAKAQRGKKSSWQKKSRQPGTRPSPNI